MTNTMDTPLAASLFLEDTDNCSTNTTKSIDLNFNNVLTQLYWQDSFLQPATIFSNIYLIVHLLILDCVEMWLQCMPLLKTPSTLQLLLYTAWSGIVGYILMPPGSFWRIVPPRQGIYYAPIDNNSILCSWNTSKGSGRLQGVSLVAQPRVLPCWCL